MIKFKQDGRNIIVKLGEYAEVTVLNQYGDDITETVTDAQYNGYIREAEAIFKAEQSEYLAERLM